MESFYIDLNEMANKKSKLYKMLALGAIVFIVLAIVSIIFFGDKFKSAKVPFITMGIYFALYMYYAWFTSRAKLHIQADDYALEYNFGMLNRTPEIIIWDTVVKVKIGPTYVAFFKRTGKRKKISLGWLPYSKVIDIKEKISKASQAKGKPCEVVDYKHYE